MKKILLIFLFLTSAFAFSQEEKEEISTILGKNELKINTTNFLIFKYIDLSYERLLNAESSLGIAILKSVSANNGTTNFNAYRTFSITPYYRQYFSKNYARGFFVEGFGMLNTQEHKYYDYTNVSSSSTNTEEINFAFGISTGAKFMTKKGFIAEVYLGIGRNILNNEENNEDIVGRGGVSLGYRF